jgi:hypothetical protein
MWFLNTVDAFAIFGIISLTKPLKFLALQRLDAFFSINSSSFFENNTVSNVKVGRIREYISVV